jgi:acylglycerol lipase
LIDLQKGQSLFILGFVDKGRRSLWQRRKSMAPTATLDNNEELRRLREVNIDEAPGRRRVRDSLKDIQLNLDHILFKVTKINEIEYLRVNF